MMSLRPPSDARLTRLLASVKELRFNHPAVGAELLSKPAPGFVLDEYGADVGHGEAAWEAALRALEAFGMYPASWTKIHFEGSPFRLGADFLAVTRQLGFYCALPCRVIALEDVSNDVERVRSFAFGTVKGHVEAGVERFRVRWDRRTDLVRLDVRAVSRPVGITRLGSPVARRVQLRFHGQAGDAFRAAMAALTDHR